MDGAGVGPEEAPETVVRNEQRLGVKTIEKAAREVVESFDLDQIAANIQAAIDAAPADLSRIVAHAKDRANELIATIHLPHLPSHADIRGRAMAILARTRSLDEIVERAHRILSERVAARVTVGAH